MKSIRLSSPLSDACAIAAALILFGAAVLDTPALAEPIHGPALASTPGAIVSAGVASPEELRRTPR
ncbi:MAG: hypothetical protein ABIS28_20625 [Caldimonas sp.]